MERPIYIVGPDRSGTTLMFALLASHPNISMVRRTNMWRYFYCQYGDLSIEANFEKCLSDMVRYNRMRHLNPDPDRIRREFWMGDPTYGHLFSLFHKHNAERNGKNRWGDKSLQSEYYAGWMVAEFPGVRILHMVRDPRDRYASVRKRNGQDLRRFGPATARWLSSVRAGFENLKQFPENYRIVQFEELLLSPEETVRQVCEFIGEDFLPEMLSFSGAGEYATKGGNSSFGNMKPGSISTKPLRRYLQVLDAAEINFIQRFAGKAMRHFGYEPEPIQLTPAERIHYLAADFPEHFVRMVGWTLINTWQIKHSPGVPAARLLPEPVHG